MHLPPSYKVQVKLSWKLGNSVTKLDLRLVSSAIVKSSALVCVGYAHVKLWVVVVARQSNLTLRYSWTFDLGSGCVLGCELLVCIAIILQPVVYSCIKPGLSLLAVPIADYVEV